MGVSAEKPTFIKRRNFAAKVLMKWLPNELVLKSTKMTAFRQK